MTERYLPSFEELKSAGQYLIKQLGKCATMRGFLPDNPYPSDHRGADNLLTQELPPTTQGGEWCDMGTYYSDTPVPDIAGRDL